MNATNALTIMGVFGLAVGCGIFDSSNENKKSSLGPGTAGVGGNGTSGAPAAVGGASGASSGVGGASTCLGLPGPGMVEVPAPSGVKYCVDRTEVTQQHYQTFLAQVKVAPGSEIEACSNYNSTYQPVQEPSSMEGASCIVDVAWTPDTTPNRPVVCIDWCDAFAYCKWAGKRLCGKVDGGRGALSSSDANDPAVDASESQWYNACSQAGKTLYPYGDTYDPQACEGADVSQADSGGWLPKQDVAARAGCRGTIDPFASISDMSGSVREMTDECFWWESSGAGSWDCAARGGFVTSGAEGMSCKSYGTAPIYVPSNGTGFRCCKDLP
jgi:formylglycine-generating enzyme